jgi:hypothetical protein
MTGGSSIDSVCSARGICRLSFSFTPKSLLPLRGLCRTAAAGSTLALTLALALVFGLTSAQALTAVVEGSVIDLDLSRLACFGRNFVNL